MKLRFSLKNFKFVILNGVRGVKNLSFLEFSMMADASMRLERPLRNSSREFLLLKTEN